MHKHMHLSWKILWIIFKTMFCSIFRYISHKLVKLCIDTVVIKHVTDIEISYEKSKLVSLRNPPKKGLYMLLLIVSFYDNHNPRVWCDILNFEVDRKVYINNIYDCMLTNMNDIKIRHGAIPTGRFYTGVNIQILLIVTIVVNWTI